MAKTVLIPQTTFTGTDTGSGLYRYTIEGLLINVNKITVVFDGVKYENVVVSEQDTPSGKAYKYGAYNDQQSYNFGIWSKEPLTHVDVMDTNSHTIEVYTEDTPSVTVQKPGVQVLQLDERLIIFDETTGDIVTFDGENWLLGNDGFGKGVMPSKYAVVGTAIVGKDVVAPQGE